MTDDWRTKARPASYPARAAGLSTLVVGESAGGPQFRENSWRELAPALVAAVNKRRAPKRRAVLDIVGGGFAVVAPVEPRGLLLPIRTLRGLNNREHPMARARRVRKEREAVVLGWAASGAHLEVWLTRISPKAAGDDDGDVGALKAVRDQVAELLGIDDGDKKRLRFRYGDPERGPYAVRIEVRLATRARA